MAVNKFARNYEVTVETTNLQRTPVTETETVIVSAYSAEDAWFQARLQLDSRFRVSKTAWNILDVKPSQVKGK